jgi:replicative DNA helicase
VAQDLDALARTMPVDMTPEKIITATADRLTHIAQEGNERASSLKYGVLLPKAIERVQKASEDASALIPWFLPEITTIAGDIRRGNLIGFMSDSGGGKTSFSLQQVRHAALGGYKAAFFSIEITEEEAALQAAAQASGISLGRLDAFTLNNKEQSEIEAEMARSMNLPFDIVPFSDCTLSDIRIRVEAMKKSTGLDLVVIDHAKMIALPGKSGDIFAERINALYRGLKAIAKSLNVAMVILIQRNEEWKSRVKAGGTPRPMIGDAYGGGSIRQNLDVWFSLYRPEPIFRELMTAEHNEKRRDEWVRKYEESKGKAALINHKRRRGEPGQSKLIKFNAEFTRFESEHSEMPPAFEGFF